MALSDWNGPVTIDQKQNPGWWCNVPILKNDGVKVSWDDDIPNWMESHEIQWFQTTSQKLSKAVQACSNMPWTSCAPFTNFTKSWFPTKSIKIPHSFTWSQTGIPYRLTKQRVPVPYKLNPSTESQFSTENPNRGPCAPFKDRHQKRLQNANHRSFLRTLRLHRKNVPQNPKAEGHAAPRRPVCHNPVHPDWLVVDLPLWKPPTRIPIPHGYHKCYPSEFPIINHF